MSVPKVSPHKIQMQALTRLWLLCGVAMAIVLAAVIGAEYVILTTPWICKLWLCQLMVTIMIYWVVVTGCAMGAMVWLWFWHVVRLVE